jgi:hypothetical protein
MGGRRDFCTTLLGQPKITLNGPSSMQKAFENSLKYMGHRYMVLAHQIR